MIKTIEFEGINVQYEDASFHSWKFMKSLMDPQKMFKVVDTLLCGNSDDVAERLGDDFEKMTSLLNRIATIESNTAKN